MGDWSDERALNNAARRRVRGTGALKMPQPKWVAVDEVGNDNFATSIYENEYKGLLVARCNQNGQYPEQAALIMRALEFSNIVSLFPRPERAQ